MSKINIIATSAFGVESITAGELKKLGYNNLSTDNGRITFEGDFTDVVKCNLWLRTADRILIRMGQFRADDFEDLYQGAKKIKWEDFIPENGKMHVVGKSVKSKLHSVPACQSTVKKAVVESMQRKYKKSHFSEDGPVYKIEVAMHKDMATLSIDTSGAGLHKRGYRQEQGEAPLRETLGAALVLISKWKPYRLLADPFCGSGTIPIEAAMIARNIAPGLKRSFVSEDWPNIPEKIWKAEREKARNEINNEIELNITASDIDKYVLKNAENNADRAGVRDDIVFQKKPVEEFSSKKKFGCLISNPPYGIRIGEKEDIDLIYKQLKSLFDQLDTWSFFILNSDEQFQKNLGKKADKNRKLYNAIIKCHLYQYFGPLPPKKQPANI